MTKPPCTKRAPCRCHGREKTEIEAWLAFADARLQHLAEVASAPKLPSSPKPSGDGLKPFLGRWNPYGPCSY
ncbi:hypothetical protein ACFWZ2_17030 [Streptomyces sp. NPDC059002]|uniref:hypothetical protein n=1 Tax=Streptomyces sp. NPDC059002 TaxID=3346690 RepID=UPI0036BA85C1